VAVQILAIDTKVKMGLVHASIASAASVASMPLDGTQDAPATTQIRCRHCGAPRGTLGELRDLSSSGQHDQFEI
jgi:hypothetical protein